KQVNSIPDFAFEQVMVRTIPQLPNQQIIDDLNALIAKFNQDGNYQLSLEVNFSGNPVSSPLDTEVVDVIQTASIDQLGTQLETGVLSMGTDASQYQAEKPGLNVFILGPGNDTAHRSDENIDLKSYYQFINLYKEVAKGYLK
ncbi:MAG: M20/M25/M40 family metallo-hydrolase, partial [Apilactobacillus sp.]|uniref:M20/M25/M40 family metallo-hydrolase n=1 Tax=Apilactobacillus sp. TaxID=2767901 RepID=UPI0025D7A8C6